MQKSGACLPSTTRRRLERNTCCRTRT